MDIIFSPDLRAEFCVFRVCSREELTLVSFPLSVIRPVGRLVSQKFSLGMNECVNVCGHCVL